MGGTPFSIDRFKKNIDFIGKSTYIRPCSWQVGPLEKNLA